jgi:Flp pilus assembly CpaE family ATPase
VTKSVFVLNHVYPKEPLRTSDVESAIGSKFALELPYDPMLYVKAVNEGVPLIIGSPKSAAADRMSRLAGLALAGDRATPTTTERRRGLGGLLRRPA